MKSFKFICPSVHGKLVWLIYCTSTYLDYNMEFVVVQTEDNDI